MTRRPRTYESGKHPDSQMSDIVKGIGGQWISTRDHLTALEQLASLSPPIRLDLASVRRLLTGWTNNVEVS